ncbi:MAG: hypothetical protein ACR2QI_10415 [Woeseiaceae bacterium]
MATIFKNQAIETGESDKLVDLFRNRSELKKEFAALRNEKYQLQDRIKQHQGATARVQQQLEHLENLLFDSEWVYNVVAFYQLRRLARHCTNQLDRFAEQLKLQREQRVQSRVLVSWNERRKQKADHVENRISEHRLALQLLEDQLQSERHKLMTMNGVVRLFRGRSLTAKVDNIAKRIESGQHKETEFLQELDAVQKLDPPENPGLDIAAKRSINFMILSYAQQLYLHYEEHDLVGLAKEATEKSVGAIRYGGKQECDCILRRLERRKVEAEQEGDLAEVLKKRAKLIAEQALFRNDDDAVPVPGTVATVFDIDPNGVVQKIDANLIGDNYFAIAKVLSR